MKNALKVIARTSVGLLFVAGLVAAVLALGYGINILLFHDRPRTFEFLAIDGMVAMTVLAFTAVLLIGAHDLGKGFLK